jgi:hypothetical protein
MVFLALAAFAFGQEPLMQPSPELPSSVVGPPVIVWSQTQQPQPIPETVTVVPPDQQEPPSQEPDVQTLAATTLNNIDEAAAAKRHSQLPNARDSYTPVNYLP